MKRKRIIPCLWVVLTLSIAVFSYAFVDIHLQLSSNTFIQLNIQSLVGSMRANRMLFAGMFVSILFALFFLWWKTFQLTQQNVWNFRQGIPYMIAVCTILLFSYTFLSYDVFNYVQTAKVAYTYHENPYVTMPVEIPNDPNLAFTRAANKVALYGPIWILLTWIPHTLGMGQIWQTIIAFKLVNIIWYVVFCYLIWRVTKNMKNVIFFALNPLVLLETIVSGHNDIVMMVLSIAGLLLWQEKIWVRRSLGLFLFVCSFFVKGATIVLFPLLFLRTLTRERLMLIVTVIMFFIFITAAPLREELYPWYAVWFLATAALLPYPKYSWLWQFCIALSFGLELRHVPYMTMGYYEGPGPVLRTALTIIPVAVWGVWYMLRSKIKAYE